MAKIQKIVDAIMEEDSNPHPSDFLFRYNSRNHPITSHNELDLPGEFLEIKDSVVFVLGKTAKQLDYLEAIKPNGKMAKREALNDVEQQSGKLPYSKVIDIFEYCLYATIQYQRPCYAIVATDYDYGKDYEDYTIEGFTFRIYFRIFDENKVQKLLNTLKQKDYSKDELTNADFIKIIHCLVFAKRSYAKKVVEELVYLFASMEHITLKHQLDLHLALKMMIKHHFKDELTKKKELIIMITKSVSQLGHDRIIGYEVEQKSNIELKEENTLLKQINLEKEQQLTQKNQQLTQKKPTTNTKKTNN